MTSPVSPENDVISNSEAIERARRHLGDDEISVAGRTVQSTLAQAYVVVFPTPPDTLGGDVTVVLDAETGEVLSVRVER